jgi:hypothetical protein
LDRRSSYPAGEANSIGFRGTKQEEHLEILRQETVNQTHDFVVHPNGASHETKHSIRNFAADPVGVVHAPKRNRRIPECGNGGSSSAW